MIIEDAELLSFRQTFATLGDVLSYRKIKEYSVNGRLTDYTNFAGISGITNKIYDQIASLQDSVPIVINGQDFGSGLINSVDYDQSTDVRDKKYTISFTVFENVDLFNVYGEYYSGVSGIENQDLKFVDNLSESFSFTTDSNNIFSYSRDLSVTLHSGLGANPLQVAKNIADIIFDSGMNVSDLNAFYPNYYSSGNRIYNEVYDIQNLECSFSERFSFQSGGNPFIWTFSHSIDKGPLATVVNEKGSVVSAAKPKEISALIGLDGAIVGAFERCSGVLSDYNLADGGCALINSPTNMGITFNKFNGIIDYDISYSNDDSISTGCITRISHDLSNSVDGPTVITEKVEIQGLGKATYPTNQKYVNAQNCYLEYLSTTGLRVSGFLAGVNNVCCSGLVPTRMSVSDSEHDGRISATREFSCDHTLRVPSPFTQIISEYSFEDGVPLHQTFPIVGYGEEVIGGCRSGNVSLSKIENSIEIYSTGTLNFDTYLSGAYAYLLQPSTGVGGFISNASFGYSSSDKKFGLTIEYSYVKFRELFDRSIR